MRPTVLIIVASLGIFLNKTTGVPVVTLANETNYVNQSNYEINETLSKLRVNKNCSLRPENNGITKKVKEMLSDGAKVIEYTLSINNSDRVFHDDVDSQMFRPFFWVRVSGRHGTSLLALRPEYDKLSLYSLAIGVEEMNVALVEEPASCLNNLTYSEIEVLIRELVMNDFQEPSGGISEDSLNTGSVCNKHIIDNDGVADFQYYCCQRNGKGENECKYLHSDFWLKLLLGIIILVKVLVVLYSPRFIPESLYRKNVTVRDFIYRHEMKLKTVLTRNPEKYKKAKAFCISKFAGMEGFNRTLKEMKLDVPYSMEMNELCLQVKYGRLLPSNYAPVGFFRSLYDAIVECKISDRESVKPCCETNVFKVCCCIRQLSWRTFLRRIMKILVLLFLLCPWIMRVFIYYEVEETEIEMQKKAAEQKSLEVIFPGNITLYVTPIHVVFIVIYAMLIFETCIFKLIGKRAQARFKLVTVRCLRDMRDTNQMDVIGWLIRGAVAPCTKYGGLGILIGLFAWVLALPFVLLIVAFYTLPTFNISMRMLAHFFAYLLPDNVCSMVPQFAKCKTVINTIETNLKMDGLKKSDGLEKNKYIMNSFKMKLEQVIVIAMCLASFISIIFLLMEFTAFIIEILVYIFMGIIVNADSMLTYLSLAFLMGVYAQDCFGFVSKTFLNFNQTMNQLTLSLGVSDVKRDIYLDEDQQSNLAFRIKSNEDEVIEQDTTPPVTLDTNMDGFPRWNVSRLCLFLDKADKPYIPRGYFFKACTTMNYHMAPGQLIISYLRATAEMSVIIVFLLGVLVVVLAFGDTYELSAGNKMLATIAGGILPFLLRNVVFKSHEAPKITKDDTDTINFQAAFHTFLRGFTQTWPMSDIKIRSITPLHDNSDSLEAEESVIGSMNGTEMTPLVKNGNGHTCATSNGHEHSVNDEVEFVIDCSRNRSKHTVSV